MNRRCVSAAVLLLFTPLAAFAAVYDAATKTATIADAGGRLQLHLNTDGQCLIDRVTVNGRSVVSPGTGVCSAVKVGGSWHTTRGGIASPEVTVEGCRATVTGIRFGGDGVTVEETWRFTELADGVDWRIVRKCTGDDMLEDAGMPCWDFADMQTWTGALLDTGGVAWCKLMGSPNATYGVHAGSVTFWNREKNDCLRIAATPQGNAKTSVRFSHQPDGVFSFNQLITGETVEPKHDLRRFLADRQDVWKPFTASGEVSVEYALSAMEYDKAYYRGDLKGIDGGAVREICNTIGRIGVIDAGIMGSNGWYSGYAVLQEPWLALMGLPINDPRFFANYAASLDYARDHAVGADGRVKPRWAHAKGDEIPGTYDERGFYECQWGIMWNAQPDYVTNVAELFDFTGDLDWVRGQKETCERVLGLALSRDSNNNGLLECMTDSHTEAKGSDWIDVVWAAFDNGFINAEMYNALLLWADVETVLAEADAAALAKAERAAKFLAMPPKENEPPNRCRARQREQARKTAATAGTRRADMEAENAAAEQYRAAAARIKETFNKTIAEGGLWNPDKGWYAHWLDRDGSVHGDNFVTPVNLMAVAYGLCDDPARKSSILDQLEAAMQRENLFFWPLCVYSYQPDEAYKVNWPFPNYENGDLFLAWGEVGMRAYADYKPEIGVKYLKKVLDQYTRDGLAFQRYLRGSQKGAGDDILANNIQPVTGLYRDIYGIQPKHDRLHLDPHLTPDLLGTQVNYTLRGTVYRITYEADHTTVSTDTVSLAAPPGAFSVSTTAHGVEYFRGRDKTCTLSVGTCADVPLDVHVEELPDGIKWSIGPTGEQVQLYQSVYGMNPDKVYDNLINGEPCCNSPRVSGSSYMFTNWSCADKTQTHELREVPAGK